MSKFADRLRAALIDALTDAAGPGRLVSPEELRRLGIPNRHASAISKISRDEVNTVEDAVDVADEWARRIASERDATDAMTPRELADQFIPRI